MPMARNRKRTILYAVCAFFFALAGVFQGIDASLPEFFHALCALLAHAILISLVVAWGVSLIHRMVRRDLRSFFLTVDALILFFLVVRMIKYGLTEDADTLSRYLWYSYYIPQCLIPPTILLAALSLESKKGKPIAKPWYLIYLPALVLIFLIFTNDLHKRAFALRFDGGFSYEHRPVFYLALAWEIVVTAAALAVLILKCGVSACKKKTWIPVCVFAVCAFVSAVCFLADTPAFKIPELLCFTCIAVIESCIVIGLIPSNEEYESYFYHSAYSAMITDDTFRTVYRSATAEDTEKSLLARAAKSPVRSDENTRLMSKKIHGGYVFVKEDLTRINGINAALAEANDTLAEENDLIEAENTVKEQRAELAEQNRLYRKTEESTRGEVARLAALLSEIERDSQKNFVFDMRFACLLAAYIKRRSNLVMLAEKNPCQDVGELALALRESLGYLALAGTECSLDFDMTGNLDGRTAGIFYDFFEICVTGVRRLPSALIVHVRPSGDFITMRIESDANAEDSKIVFEKIKTEFPEFENNISAEIDGEVTCYILSLPREGVL